MAESTGQPANNPSSRYFCHQCDRDISPLPDFICPHCHTGFIEELDPQTQSSQQTGTGSRSEAAGPFIELLNSLLQQNSAGRFHGPTAASSSGQPGEGWNPIVRFEMTGPGGSVPVDGLGNTIQQLISSVAAGALHPHDPRHPSAHMDAEFRLPLFEVLHGNPADYVWGSGGLDTVITQLLNNLEGSGPPPLAQNEIDRIPFVEVSEEDVAKNMQCSVCMDELKLAERVRKLPCAHLFHTDCIVPWLQMHATCPICRKTISLSDSVPTAPSGQSSSDSSRRTGSDYFDLNEYD